MKKINLSTELSNQNNFEPDKNELLPTQLQHIFDFL